MNQAEAENDIPLSNEKPVSGGGDLGGAISGKIFAVSLGPLDRSIGK
ncbi:MAG: hypothetical protein ACETV0_02910 [Nitrososphaeria archaeon]